MSTTPEPHPAAMSPRTAAIEAARIAHEATIAALNETYWQATDAAQRAHRVAIDAARGDYAETVCQIEAEFPEAPDV